MPACVSRGVGCCRLLVVCQQWGATLSKSFTSSRISGAKITKPLDPQSLARQSTFSIGEFSNCGNKPVQLQFGKNDECCIAHLVGR